MPRTDDFWIRYEGPTSHDPELGYGRIKIDDFEQRFEMDLSFWSSSHYQRHWLEGAERLLAGAGVSCLISAMRDPRTANFIEWWPLYRLGDEVKIQNQLVLMQNLPGILDPAHPFRLVPPRTIVSTEGTPISEWTTSLNALQRFVDAAR